MFVELGRQEKQTLHSLHPYYTGNSSGRRPTLFMVGAPANAAVACSLRDELLLSVLTVPAVPGEYFCP